MSHSRDALLAQELVRYSIAIHDKDMGQQPPRWAQATPRSWLPQPPLPQLGLPPQPGPPRLMAAGQPPFQVSPLDAVHLEYRQTSSSAGSLCGPFRVTFCLLLTLHMLSNSPDLHFVIRSVILSVEFVWADACSSLLAYVWP